MLTSFFLFAFLAFGWIFRLSYWYVLNPVPRREQIAWYRSHPLVPLYETLGPFAVLFVSYRYPLSPTSIDSFFMWAGIGMFTAGLVFCTWARKVMGKYWLQDSAGHNFKRQDVLHTTEPFRFSRNPIYVGIICMWIGFCLALRSPFIILVLFLMYRYARSVKTEEQLMEKYFGKRYIQYKKYTPRWLFV